MQTEPSWQTPSQYNTTQLLQGWQAARSGESLDRLQSAAWQAGHDLWTQRGQMKAARLMAQQVSRLRRLQDVLAEF
jgi:hypothetical protein